MTKEDKQYAFKKVLDWLNKSDAFISREAISRYSAVDFEIVKDCFNWLEQKEVISFNNSSGSRAIYKQNKQSIRCMVDELKLFNNWL